jgi:phosphoribosylanthranilate isomerase
VATEIKFCGLTRREDAHFAAELGATYVGVIFAGGPRALTIERAADVLSKTPQSVKRVGVFADQSAQEIAHIADRLDLSVIQIHSNPSSERISEIRSLFSGEVWPVCRVPGNRLPVEIDDLMSAGTGILLDAHVAGTLGGTGVTLPWADLASEIATLRSRTRLVLAGGLKPTNVGAAIHAVAPHVVDVSSGVEQAPGIKDHNLMRAFRDAVLAAHAVHASLKS